MQDLLTNLVVFITLAFAVVATIDFVVGLACLANSVAEQAIAPPLASQATASADLHQEAQAIAPDPTSQTHSEPAIVNDLQRYPVLELLLVQSSPVANRLTTADIAAPACCCQELCLEQGKTRRPNTKLPPPCSNSTHTAAIANPLLVPPVAPETTSPFELTGQSNSNQPDLTNGGDLSNPDLTKVTAEQLRKLCSAKGISWRNARGSGRHLRKQEMITALTAL